MAHCKFQTWRCQKCGEERVWGAGIPPLRRLDDPLLVCQGKCRTATRHLSTGTKYQEWLDEEETEAIRRAWRRAR